MSIFKKYSYWIHSGKYTAIQKFSVLGMGIVSFMLLTRVLGPEGFGVWGLFLTISSITETARTALIKNAFIRFMHQTPEEEHGNLQTGAWILSLSISIALALIFLLAAYSVSQWLNAPELGNMLQWYAITLLMTVLFSQCEMLLNAKMDFRGVCYMYVIRQGLLLAAIGACALANYKITPGTLSLFYLVSVIAGGLTGALFSRPYFRWDLTGYKPWIGKLWRFGRYVFGNNVSSLLFRSTDNFITSNMFGTAVSAYYNACLRIGNLVDMPSQVLGDVLFPKAAQYNSSDRGAIKHMYERTVGAILVFSIPALLVLILLPSLILHFLAGGKFMMAAPVLRITAFFGFTLPFLKQFGTIMDATGHPDTNFRVMFLALCIDILANLLGVHFFGIIGAAIGTATTYFIIFVITQTILYKRFGVEVLNIFRNTFSLYKELFFHGKSLLKLKETR
ncbi:MAG TPA: oligosaccharide flippase family protein [Puia sp.]|nr:oligosaccharide flippase family protein [Puia sp.]